MSEPDLAVTENGRERGKRLRTQRIIGAARQLIHERPDQTPTDPEVAARAGVAPMTIFNLIGNRDDIWAALADESLADWQSVASGVTDPQKRAHKIVDEVMRIISEEAPVFRALISGWRDSGRVLERAMGRGPHRRSGDAQTRPRPRRHRVRRRPSRQHPPYLGPRLQVTRLTRPRIRHRMRQCYWEPASSTSAVRDVSLTAWRKTSPIAIRKTA
jgi:AcrR family transcriptional regulator